MKNNLKLVVIIPTKNRLDDLIITLNSILDQTYLPEYILIIDQSEKNNRLVVKNNYENKINLKYEYAPNLTGLAQARNYAISLIKNAYDVVLFLDDDVILESEFISNIIKVYSDENIYGVGGVITNYSSNTNIQIFQKIFNKEIFFDIRQIIYSNYSKYDRLIPTNILGGGLMIFRKLVLDEYKFDERYIKYSLGEDLDYSLRVSSKYKLFITPKAKLKHLKSDNERYDTFNQYKTRVAASIFLFKNHKRSLKRPGMTISLKLVGQLLLASVSCVRKISFRPLYGYFSGIVSSINNFKNIDFIKEK